MGHFVHLDKQRSSSRSWGSVLSLKKLRVERYKVEGNRLKAVVFQFIKEQTCYKAQERPLCREVWTPSVNDEAASSPVVWILKSPNLPYSLGAERTPPFDEKAYVECFQSFQYRKGISVICWKVRVGIIEIGGIYNRVRDQFWEK